MDYIELADLKVECLIGILDHERKVPQAVLCDLRLELGLERAARTGDLSASVDYAALAKEVTTILEEGRFRLLETAALAICAAALTPPPGQAPVSSVRVCLRKPAALGGIAVPAVTLTRGTADVTLPLETPDCAISRTDGGDLRVTRSRS